MTPVCCTTDGASLGASSSGGWSWERRSSWSYLLVRRPGKFILSYRILVYPPKKWAWEGRTLEHGWGGLCQVAQGGAQDFWRGGRSPWRLLSSPNARVAKTITDATSSWENCLWVQESHFWRNGVLHWADHTLENKCWRRKFHFNIHVRTRFPKIPTPTPCLLSLCFLFSWISLFTCHQVMYVCMYVCMYVSIYLSIYLSIYQSSIYLSNLSTYHLSILCYLSPFPRMEAP